MMSLQTIRDLSAQAARRAAKEGRVPKTFWDHELTGEDITAIRGIPNLGDHRPSGWNLVDDWLVDKTGWGSESEPALTLEQFIANLDTKHGFAIIEEGQFQVVIGVFEHVPEDDSDLEVHLAMKQAGLL